MNIIFVCLFSMLCATQSFASIQEPQDRVFISILARNKAHTLPYYLLCLDNLEYDKQLITVYINTNNNSDATEEILREWAKKNKNEYKEILFESHEVESLPDTLPHDWTAQRFKVLGAIRNKSLQIAKDSGSDYYFVVDCDNFITPPTLKHLVLQRKPIIAPMLIAIPDSNHGYSNFFCDIDPEGYYQEHSLYWHVLGREIIGTIEVPLVHCTYLIDLKYVDKLTYDDDSTQHEFVIFSRSARNNGVDQYICNEINFGTILHDLNVATLEEEKKSVDAYFSGLNNQRV